MDGGDDLFMYRPAHRGRKRRGGPLGEVFASVHNKQTRYVSTRLSRQEV